MAPEQLSTLASVVVAFFALVFTSMLLARQARQMEHERNAVALLEAISRLTSPNSSISSTGFPTSTIATRPTKISP